MICKHNRTINWVTESNTSAQRNLNVEVYSPWCVVFPIFLMRSCLCADLLLLKDEENLKCFTSTQYDFTCFFETSDNRTYDLFYSVSRCVQQVYM